MKLHRIFQTIAVRLALRYALVYAVVLSIAMAIFLWVINRHIDADVKAGLTREMSSLMELHASRGEQGLIEALRQQQEGGDADDRIYLLVSRDHEKLAGNLNHWPADADIPLDGRVHGAWIEDNAIPRNLYDDDAYWPVIAHGLPDGGRLLLAHNTEQYEALKDFAEYIYQILGAAFFLAVVMGMTLGRKILGRMEMITRTAGEIATGDLARRIPISGRNDEFDVLAARLNAMLDRIQLLIKGIRDVTDNIAHELRSPLTRLRNRFEVALLSPRGESDCRQAIAKGVEDIESLLKTFNTLLSIAQAEAGNDRTQWGPVDLIALMNDLAELFGAVAEEKGLVFDKNIEDCGAVTGSRELLAHAISNLLENAIKYTPQGGRIGLRLTPVRDGVEISVSDTGPGIPAAERGRVLERFVRLDRAEDTPGTGLGLSLVDAVAKLHHAQLTLSDAQPGLVVTFKLPRA